MVAERQLAQVVAALAGAGVPALRYLDVLVPRARVDHAEKALNGPGHRPPETPTVR
jgi:hypothetical protein